MSQLSKDLLEQAASLVTREKKKPKQASVRRAISTAYYALFHFISDKVTGKFVGTTNDMADARVWLGRALEHRTMKSACQFFGNQKAPAFQALCVQLGLTPNADLEAIADTFVNLQEARHRADYDLSKLTTRVDAQDAIAKVGLAFIQWNRVEEHNPQLIRIFSMGLMHWNSLGKRS